MSRKDASLKAQLLLEESLSAYFPEMVFTDSGITVQLHRNTHEGCYRYQPVLADENQEIADWLLRLTANQRNWGFGLCFLYLRNVKGFGWNHKRVYRIYRALELNLRIKPKKRLVRAKPEPLAVPDQPESLLVDGLYA